VRYEILAGGRTVATGQLRLAASPGRTGMTQKISVNSKYVEPPAAEYPRIEREVGAMKAVHSFYTNVRFFSGEPVFPVLEGRLGSPFGEQRVLNGGRPSVHYGVDIRSNRNKAVVSLYPGRVIFTGNLYFSGNTVVVAHGYGLMSQYLHLSRITVQPGEFVKAGQRIGTMGMTGRATGPHLHLSCYLMGVQFNPMSLFNKGIR
jgi:murein DD-endopeptidase MepM/ murein hydrolase activator NlpD